MALAYRSHFALVSRPIYNSKGVNTSALFVFTKTLIDMLQNQRPTHIAVAFDMKRPRNGIACFPSTKFSGKPCRKNQGTAADMIKLAMIQIHRELVARKLRSRMILQVHDELIFDLHAPERDEVTALVEDRMKNALALDVPVVVEIGASANWLEAH